MAGGSGGGQAYSSARGSHFNFTDEEVDDYLFVMGVDSKDGPDNPLYDPRVALPLDDGIFAAINDEGVLDPIEVTPRWIDDKGNIVADGSTGATKRPFVVDGKTRVMHLRAVNKARRKAGEEPHGLSATNSNLTDDEIIKRRIMRNAARRELDLVTKVSECYRIHSNSGKSSPNMGTDELAVMFACSVSTIENWLALARAKAKVRNAAFDGTIPPTAGYRIAKLPLDEQEDALQELLDQTKGGRGSARAAQQIKTARRGGGGGKNAAPNGSADRPSMKDIKKILDAAEAEDAVKSCLQQTDGWDLLRWIHGDITNAKLPKPIKDVLK